MNYKLIYFFRDEHKRLCPQCPYVKLGKEQDSCTVKEVMELCQISLKNFVVSILYLIDIQVM
jgi:hypothetical protein